MPPTLPSQDNNDNRIELGVILEKIRRGGSKALNEKERLFVVEIFRQAAVTDNKRIKKVKDEISIAHLEYCFRLEQ